MKKNAQMWYWITTVSLFLVMMFNCGVGYYSIALFVTPMSKTFGISSGDFAVIYIFYGVGSAIAAAFLHRLLKRVQLRHLIMFGGLISAVGYVLFSVAENLSVMFFGGALIGASTVFSGTAAVQLAIARWFSQRRSQITGLVASASGIGTAVGSPVVGWIIRTYEWRAACSVIGGLVAVFVCIQVAFLLREDPARVGLMPYGARAGENPEMLVPIEEDGIPIQAVWRTGNFWLFACGMIVVSVVYQTISLYQSTILIERGFSEGLAAICLSVFAVVDMCCKASAGIVADKRGFRLVTLYCAVATALAFVVIQTVHSAAGAILFSALLGFWPTMCVLYGVTASIGLFGKKYLSEYIGFTQTVMCCCSLVSMPAIKQLYNSVGNFDLIIAIVMGLLGLFFVMMVVMLRPSCLYIHRRQGAERT